MILHVYFEDQQRPLVVNLKKTLIFWKYASNIYIYMMTLYVIYIYIINA